MYGDGCLAEVRGGDALSCTPVIDSLHEGLRRQPHGPAVISHHQPSSHLAELACLTNAIDQDYLCWTYTELDRVADRLATALLPYRKAGRCFIACFVWNSVEWALLYWATAKLRATLACLDPRLLEPERKEELEYHLDEVQPDMVFVWQLNDYVKSVFARSDRPLRLKVFCDPCEPEEKYPEWKSFKDVASEATSSNDVAISLRKLAADSNVDDAALILFTSGTTSRPKGAVHTARMISSSTSYYSDGRRFDESSTYLWTSLNFRAICPHSSVCAWRAGAAIAFAGPGYDADVTLDLLDKYGYTHIVPVPMQIRILAHKQATREADLSRVSWVGCGGDVLTRDVIDLAQDTFPDAFISPNFGMTEGSGMASWSRSDAKASDRAGVMGLGRVMAGSSIRVCKSGTHDTARREEVGDLWVSGANCIALYLNERNPEAFVADRQERWLITGDRALIDDDGVLFVLGRFKDVIARAGFKLSPSSLEMSLRKQEGIQDAHVIGMSHKELGEAPVAIVKVQLENAISKTEITKSVMQELGPESKLEAILTLRDLSLNDYPVNSTGKVSKTDLKALLKEKGLPRW